LHYICNKHPEVVQTITFAHLMQGHGCAKCAGNYPLTYEEISQQFKDRNYELLTSKEEYES